METPWKIKVSDSRTSDSLPTFIIFCEDGEVEPEYFLCFGTDKIKISPIRNCGKQHSQIDSATDYCRENDLLEMQGDVEVLKLDDGAQVWCVFDRDKEEGDRRDTAFSDSINMAELKGFRTAWSNDDFELWILLHFEDIDPADPVNRFRQKYYDRLTEILKGSTPKSEEERKITSYPTFNYYNAMKSKKRFLSITLQHMKGKTRDAIKRSKELEAYHTNPPKPHHEKCPCTKVHYLVEELLRLGGQMI